MPTIEFQGANELLAALPRAGRDRLLFRCRPCELEFGTILYEPGKAMRHVYFPTGALISLLTAVDRRNAIEVGMIGREGVLGVPLMMGVTQSPVRALVQGAGSALRMTSADFLKELARSPDLRHVVLRFAHALTMQISQSAACNRFHQVDARLARWLLMTRDRVGAPEFQLTHQFLANMLGVRREGVTQAANRLQKRSLIEFGRGHLSILNVKGLEAAACACYAVVRLRGRKPARHG
jgi:CRP-like cAMP-binding protein